MCGIIGIVQPQGQAASGILEGLKRLEYRGYDSAGIATLSGNLIERRRAPGKLSALAEALARAPLPGSTGIGHTRWATHGIPNESNAHPHATAKVAVVHNGIIENYRELKTALLAKGHRFASETDSEVIPVLITSHLDSGASPKDAVAKTLKALKGAYAFAAIFSDHPNLIIAARHGAPLAVGYGKDAMYVGSDALGLSGLTHRVAYLEDGDWAVLTPTTADIFDLNDKPVERTINTISHAEAASNKGNYQHYMQKEIFEQPSVVGETLGALYNPARARFELPKLPFDGAHASRAHLIACGTSHYASLVARYWLESIARLPAEADIASEFRYRAPILARDAFSLVISQSGETADTLAALRYAKECHPALAIVNVAQSSIAREASLALQTQAGPEIGVASTKAFTTQLAVLAALTLSLAETRGACSPEELDKLTFALLGVPSLLADALRLDSAVAGVAKHVVDAHDVLYLGRGTSYAIAYEGALKLKEISYIHAEAYAAGEMKHGPIALIDDNVPIIAIAPYDSLFDKTASNLQEAAARGGKIILLSDTKGASELMSLAQATIVLPDAHPFITPLLYALPVQMLAYHVALLKGTDVDQPRNLAKSVTVE